MKHAAAIRLFTEWCLLQPDLTGFHVRTDASLYGDSEVALELILDWGDYRTLRRISRLGSRTLVEQAEDMAITARRELADQKAKVARRYLP